MVAFAVTRRYGNAVERNRFRRRLRSIVRDLDRQGSLPNGLFLIGTTSATREHSFESLAQAMASIAAEISRESSD